MDNILIWNGGNEEEHWKLVEEVLQILMENDLFLKAEKCEFGKKEIHYLGVIIKDGKVSMDPVKIEGIKYWPTPVKVKDVQIFLGFGNFYRRFIKNFSNIA